MGDHVDRLLDQWRRERPELDTRPLAVSARITRLDRILQRWSADLLGGTDLTEGELNVLAALRRSGPPHELSPTELSRALLLSSGAMTNRIDRLERAGYVIRDPSTTDRRRIPVRLTSEGAAIIDELMSANVARQADALTALDAEEQAVLARLLARLLEDLESRPPGGDR